ncbi:MAG: glycoside hydrolase family 127 protein [Anaerolineae bacterium]|nr:glycoside hydrolase family 127 protein [Anaerolineae bacterium]
MSQTFVPIAPDKVALGPGLLRQRFELNRRYMLSLRPENLLQNHYLEAGLWSARAHPQGIHWGWEAPTCELRGHFLGHWLSAAARIYAATGDPELKVRADHVVAELGRCQRENGGEWAGSIPPKYLDWIARGKRVWAPHYTLHKTLMGLYEAYALTGNAQALEIMVNWARWFHRWTGQFSRQEMDDILDIETGGMLEAWANLYGATGEQEHLDLVQRYDRPRLFDPLLKGEDVLTNQHANTTIPEAHGAARAWEVTGDPRWRAIAEAYWRSAVTERGYYCTGGQTCGEVWTPPRALAARLGTRNQEHCTVYNMMRLAEYLLRWTGDVSYADYWERNLYNGILAQQHPQTGMIAYFLSLRAGSTKTEGHGGWGTPTDDFWCCHGSLVQAHASPGSGVYYQDAEGLVVCQYAPTALDWAWEGVPVRVTQTADSQAGSVHRPGSMASDLEVRCARAVAFALKIRLPWWLRGEPAIAVNGEPYDVPNAPSSYYRVSRTWGEGDRVRVELPKGLTSVPLPDEPGTVAFMNGPVVLAGLCDEERTLYGDPDHPEAMLVPDNEREWGTWLGGYRGRGQSRGLRLVPLYEIADERYAVYFPVDGASRLTPGG